MKKKIHKICRSKLCLLYLLAGLSKKIHFSQQTEQQVFHRNSRSNKRIFYPIYQLSCNTSKTDEELFNLSTKNFINRLNKHCHTVKVLININVRNCEIYGVTFLPL